MYKGGDPFGPETEAIVPTIVVICNAQGKAQCKIESIVGVARCKGWRARRVTFFACQNATVTSLPPSLREGGHSPKAFKLEFQSGRNVSN